MPTNILRNRGANVQPDSEKNFDRYETLIAELHRFLDRLVAEPREPEDVDPVEIFMRRNIDE